MVLRQTRDLPRIHRDRVEVEHPVLVPAGERDQIPLRAPSRLLVVVALKRQPAHVRAVRGHRVDLRRPSPFRDEGDALAVGAPGRGDIDPARFRDPARAAAVGLRDVHVRVVVLRG